MVLISHLYPEIIKTLRGFIISDDKLFDYMQLYLNQVTSSLDEKTAEEAAIKSYVTYVNKLPTGDERGNYLALQFGDPTVRIMLLTLLDEKCDITCQSFDIPSKYMVGKSEKLFDFLAKCISDFLKPMKLKMLRIPLGVTFGFPIEQISLQNCVLLRWTKGFKCDDLIGKNVFTKLTESIRKFPIILHDVSMHNLTDIYHLSGAFYGHFITFTKHLNPTPLDLKRIFVIGVLNETVSVLLASTVQDPMCKIGMVIGHIANCCYAEKISRISKYQAKTFGEKYMYMNLDAASLGEDGSLDEYRNEFDVLMDSKSGTSGKLINEKLTSMGYMGEIARLALVRCIENNIILGGEVMPKLSKKDSFKYTHMMRIESDPENNHSECRAVLQEFGYGSVTDEDCIQVQFLCRCISRRAANLIAAQLAALMSRINEPSIAIALEGEMINEYPNFEWYLTRKLNQLKKEQYSFRVLKLEENGLGRGAAVMASIFGEEVMDRDEKLRRLPGFCMDRCHFRKTGKCLNPNCCAAHPCDKSGVNPVQDPIKAESQDLSGCFSQGHCPKKNACVGYDQL